MPAWLFRAARSASRARSQSRQQLPPDDGPEPQAVAPFLGLVAQPLAGDQGAGPAAAQLKQMQAGLGHAPAATNGLAFVPGVRQPGSAGSSAGSGPAATSWHPCTPSQPAQPRGSRARAIMTGTPDPRSRPGVACGSPGPDCPPPGESAGMSRVTTAPAPMMELSGPYGDAWADDGPAANPAVIADPHRLVVGGPVASLQIVHGVGGGVDLYVGASSTWLPMHLAHVEYGDVEVEEGLLADVDVAAEFAGEGGLIQQESGQWAKRSRQICWRRT